jgi:pSer/pThr/pTyr-binding forkhead associated (FHA) protein
LDAAGGLSYWRFQRNNVSSDETDGGGPPTETALEIELGSLGPPARPYLFVILEGERPLSGGARYDLSEIDEVSIGRGASGSGREVKRGRSEGKRRLSFTTSGQFLSKDHASLQRSDQGWVVLDRGSRNGVLVNGVQIDGPALLNPGDVVTLGRVFLMVEVEESEALPDIRGEDDVDGPPGFVTLVPSFEQQLARLRQEAPRNTAITLVGETGTGKEVMAKAIHAASGRRGPYIGINCGAIARSLIESELFGHVKGAFSGAATERLGHIREANHGTLLLDEIVAAPQEVQVALLRVIQEREVTPVGGRGGQSIDVRFVAAAQRPLADAVEEMGFRPDLQARLGAFTFQLPPLRERIQDVGILVAATLRRMGVTEKDNPRLSLQAATNLVRYDWPRNIRELAQAIDVAWGSAKNGEIGDADLPKPKPEEGASRSRLKQQLVAQLRAARGNVAEVARKMGRTRPLIYNWLKRFDIDPESFR